MEKLRISDNGRYFVKADGTPFTWLADTDWTMPQRMKWDDVVYLMETRKKQGFTVLQIVALDPEQDLEMRDPAGHPALIGGDLSRPNKRYFEYLDWILDKAEEYGFYVLLVPVWGQLVVGWYWGGAQFPKTVTEENAGAFGEWIGRRYKDRNHVIWCLGGDRMPVCWNGDFSNVWRRLAEGIAKGVTGKTLKYNVPDPAWKEIPMTYHPCDDRDNNECSSMSWWTEEECWLAFTMLQSGHRETPKNYEIVKKEYEAHRRPVWDGEPAYECMPVDFPPLEHSACHGSWIIRRRAYWSLLAGAFGFTYGNGYVWSSTTEREINFYSRGTWYQGLGSEGAGQMLYLRRFMDALLVMTGIPCQEALVPDPCDDSIETHRQCARAQNGDWLCVYLAGGGTVRLYPEKIPEKLRRAAWLNPRSGEVTDPQAWDGESSLESPDCGREKDWVLILAENDEIYDRLKGEDGNDQTE